MFRSVLLLFFVFPIYIIFAAEGEPPFIPNDPPRRADAGVEYEALRTVEEAMIRVAEGERIIVRRLASRSLIGRVELQLRADVPTESVRAVVQVIDDSGDSLTVYDGKFDNDGRLEATFDGVYGSAAIVTISGAGAENPLADLQLGGIVLGGTPRIMLIGDSITDGKFADDMIGFRKALYDQLRAAGESFDFVGAYGDPPYEGHFQGSMKISDFYPQGMTLNARGRMDVTGAMNSYRPNIAAIHLGTNDLNSETGYPIAPYGEGMKFADTQAGELATLVNYLLEWHNGKRGTELEAVVVSLVIPIKYQDSVCVALNVEAARMINDFRDGRITGRQEPVYLTDHFGRFREWPNLVENGYKALMYDTLHPNSAGHNLMGKTYFETLQPLLSGRQKWFSDITWYAGVGGYDHYFENQGIAAADLDGDGRDELYTSRTNSDPPNPRETLYMQDGRLPFVDQTAALQLEDAGASRGLVFFDMDNDGDLDLFNGNSGARNRLYENLGGDFREVTSGAGIANLNRVTTGVVALDVDIDGLMDLYAVNSREKNELYMNQGGGRFALQDRGADDANESSVPSMSVAAADFDQDGDIDIFIPKRGGANKLFVNNGAGRFTDGTASAGLALTANCNAAVFADLDNDGDLDLVLGLTVSSANPSPNLVIYENRGDGTFVERNLSLAMNGYSPLVADFDNDGDLDILATQESDYAFFYRNDGGWRFTKLNDTGAEIHAGDPRAAVVLDDDEDGDLDVMVARADMFNVFLRNNLDNGYHFLKINARGPGGSAVGYGTKLWLYQPGKLGDKSGLLGSREVQSTGGHISQSSPTQHFGVKNYRSCDLLAQFTDGSFLALRDLEADQTIEIAPPVAASTQTPALIAYVGGNGQRGTVGEALSEALVTRVTDANGRAVSGVAVDYAVVEGDAQLFLPNGETSKIALVPEQGELSGAAQRAFDESCANQGMVFVPPQAHAGGTVRIDKTVLNSGGYALWLRAFNGGAASPVKVRVDGEEKSVSVANASTWQWLPVGEFWQLAAGTRRFEVTLNAPLQIDQLILTTDGAFRPSGTEELIAQPELTDAQGLARRFVQLNTVAGAVKVQANLSANGALLPNSPIVFNLEALPGPAVSMHENGGNYQSGKPGEALAAPFVVTVLDAFGNRVPNVAVNFVVQSGGGSLTEGVVVLTNSNGRAENTLIPGTGGVQQIVRAEAALSGSPITFYVTVAGLAQRMALISGSGQSATVLSTLPEPITVRVLSQTDQPVSDYSVVFSTADEGAKLSATQNFTAADSSLTLKTDAQGYASAFWRLGKTSGTQRLTINGGVLEGSPTAVAAQAFAGPPTLLLKIDGDEQSAVVNRPLPKPLAVRLVDAGGNAVVDYPVTFTVRSDGSFGGKTSATVKTDAAGNASANFTLGKSAGRQKIAEASAEWNGPVGGSPAEFYATAVADVAALAGKLSGDGQSGAVQSVLPAPLVVKITDAFGNPVSDFNVTFTIIDGNGKLNGANSRSTRSDSDGLAQAFWQLGPSVGAQRVRASCPGLTPSLLEFAATAAAGDPTQFVYIAGNGQTGSPNAALADSFVVRVADAFGNAVAGHEVQFAVTSLLGDFDGVRSRSATTNAFGMASVLMTLGEQTGDSVYTAEASAVFDEAPLAGSPVRFWASAQKRPPQKLIAVSPTAGLVGAPMRELSQPIVVSVRDAADAPVAGFPVEMRITAGGGSFAENGGRTLTAVTDARGEASGRWVLGGLGLTQRMTVSAIYNGAALTGSPATFYAVTKQPRAAQLTRVSDEHVTASSNSTVEVICRILDEFGTPFEGQPVTFAKLRGDGRFEATDAAFLTTTSDARGIAAVRYVMGGSDVEIEARAFGENGEALIGSPLSFRVAILKRRLLIIAGDGQQAPVNTTLPTALRVQAVEESGAGMKGVEIVYSILQGDGQFNGESELETDENGIAEIGYRFAGKSGVHRIRAASLDFDEPVQFNLRALPETAVRIRIAGGNRQTGVAGHALNQKLNVQALDRFNNGVAGVTVAFAPQQGGVTVPTAVSADSNGIAAAEWRLGLIVGEQTLFAASDALANSPLIFKAEALPNQPPTLHLPDSLTVDENELLVVKVSAVDIENDTISIVAMNLPSGATFDVAKRQFVWRPDFTQAGRYSPAFYAADHLGASSIRVLPMWVINVNRPPVITASQPVPRDLGQIKSLHPIDFTVAAIDPDDDPLNYLWRVNNQPAAVGSTFRLNPQLVTGTATVQALVFDHSDTVSVMWRLRIVTSVELMSFTGTFEPFVGAVLTWQTRTARGTLGFVVERAERAEGPFTVISGLIPVDPVGNYRFCDDDLQSQAAFYRLIDVQTDGAQNAHQAIRVEQRLPEAFVLHQNFPNPFNSSTALRFELPQAAEVRVEIYDLLGRRTRLLLDAPFRPGYHRVQWDGRNDAGYDAASGMYTVSVTYHDRQLVRKIMVVR